MTSTIPYELPPEALSLMLPAAAPLTPAGPAAHRLTMLAEKHDTGGRWLPVEEIFRDRPEMTKHLRQTGLSGGAVNRDPAYGGAPLAVGRTKRFDNLRPAWFAVVGGDVLRHQGRPVVFRAAGHAQRAALLADAAFHMRRVVNLVPTALGLMAELAQLSDEHDPTIPPPQLTPRMRAYRCAAESEGNPLREFSLAMFPLFGAWVRLGEESRQNPLSGTVSVVWPETLAPMFGAACALINQSLEWLDEVFDSDYQAAIEADHDRLFRALGER